MNELIKEIEKKAAKLKNAVDKAKSIALFSHRSPDADTIGAVTAFYFFLTKLKKKVLLYCDDFIPEHLKFIHGSDKYNINDYKCDLAISLDCASAEMLRGLKNKYLSYASTINIDHHQDNKEYAKINIVSNNVSSCCELSFIIAKALDWEIDTATAENLYAGIVDDTGSFAHSNVKANTFEVCAELLKLGVDSNKISNLLYDSKPIEQINAFARGIKNSKFDFNRGIAYSYITKKQLKKCGAIDVHMSNFSNYLLSVAGIKIAFLILEKKDYCTCSLRSKKDYDCSKIAKIFGGGGHINASGCRKDNVNPKKFLKQVLKSVENNLKN